MVAGVLLSLARAFRYFFIEKCYLLLQFGFPALKNRNLLITGVEAQLELRVLPGELEVGPSELVQVVLGASLEVYELAHVLLLRAHERHRLVVRYQKFAVFLLLRFNCPLLADQSRLQLFHLRLSLLQQASVLISSPLQIGVAAVLVVYFGEGGDKAGLSGADLTRNFEFGLELRDEGERL